MELLLAFLLFLTSLLHQATTTTSHSTYNAIFNFGDSLSDTGNFLILAPTLISQAIGNPPYGETYFHRPTGRISDGRLVVDFIAQDMSLPLLPPYLAQGQDFSKGANFAVARATARDLSFYQQNNLTSSGIRLLNTSLSVQLGWFENLIPSLCNSTDACNLYFNNSLFIVGSIGYSDYNTMIFAGKTIGYVNSQVPAVIGSITSVAQSLLNQGVRRMVLPGVVPLGCIPRFLTFFSSPNVSDYDTIGCLRQFNNISQYHNNMLHEAVAQLQAEFPKAIISYADYYKQITQFLTSPRQYGFSTVNGSTLVACCGGGGPYNYNVTAQCGQVGAAACPDASTVNWNGITWTEKTYSIIANGWLNGPYAIPPIHVTGVH